MGIWRDMFNDAAGAVTFPDFIFAVKTGNNAYVREYLQKYPKALDKHQITSGRSALMWAIIEGRVDTVKLLLEQGASIMYRDTNGHNVLHLAALSGSKEKIDLLLKRNDVGPLINDKNPQDGATPLMYLAMVRDEEDLARRLIDKGADRHLKDLSGRTAISIARSKGFNKMASVLQNWRQQKPGPKRFEL